jgi:hypothetical protein
MTLEEKAKLLSNLLWDTNQNVNEIWPVYEGTVEKIGYIDKTFLFKRTLESYSWFTVLELFPIHEVKIRLTKELILKLRSQSLQKKYLFLHDLLQRIDIKN